MPADGPRAAVSDGRTVVWDVAVRVLHAALAGLVLFDAAVDDGGPVHRTIGYVAVAVVLARWLWAAVARGESRWTALKPSLPAACEYVCAGAPRTLGHDPLGLWMVWLLWTLVLLLGVTGWMSRLDAFWGDDRVHAVHAWLADALLVAVALHLAGVAVMSWRWRENLPAAMVTGRKRDLDPPL